MIVANIVFIWITIGLVINLFSTEKIPFKGSGWTKQDRKDFFFDIIAGPLAIIAFIIYLNKTDDE